MMLSNILAIYLILVSFSTVKSFEPEWDKVRGLRKVKFKLKDKNSDEFNGNDLDQRKWDVHALRNENTGCPKWAGPVDWKKPMFSTYHQTMTQTNGQPVPLTKRNYQLQSGHLNLRVTKENRSYFKDREYYCDKKTFRCNWNKDIRCFGTTYSGDPILKDPKDPGSYRYVVHDKCKKEPYCIPHPSFVTGFSRKYNKFLGINISGKKLFKYGFFEARVRIAKTRAITAVWMHDDNVVPSFDRWYKDKKTGWYILESPSFIRSRRWQEIDILEAANSRKNNHLRSYFPNIHVFAAYKGEYTSKRKPRANKFGPIVLDRDVFTQRNPEFSPPDPDRNNEYHMNFGSTTTLDSDWADEWRTVGMYWSKKEIRFLLDGKETLRIKNRLVHQPMFWTFGTGIHRQWAGKLKRKDLGEWSKIDYLRRWKVKTKNGKEPPSDLPLLDLMGTNFKDIGNRYNAVEGIFPVKDDGKSVPDPVARQFFGDLIGKFPLIPGTNDADPLDSITENSGLEDFVDMPWSFWANSNDPSSDESNLVDVAGEENEMDIETGPSGFKERMSSERTNAITSLESRMREAESWPHCDREMARTIFDDGDGATNLAGWATDDGRGINAGVVPSFICGR